MPADQFRATTLEAPGIRIVTNFRIQEMDSARCLLSTETRVYAVGTHTIPLKISIHIFVLSLKSTYMSNSSEMPK